MSKSKPATQGGSGSTNVDEIKGLSKELQRTQDLLRQAERDLEEERLSMKDLRERLRILTTESMDTIEYMQIEMKRVKLDADGVKSKNVQIQRQCEEQIERLKRDMRALEAQYQTKLTESENQVALLQAQVDQMSVFRDMQSGMERQVNELKSSLENKDKEHASSASAIEHRFVQQKAQLKSALEMQVQEVIKNFQKITDERVVKSTNIILKENAVLRDELARANARIATLTDSNVDLKSRNMILEEDNQTYRILEAKMAKRLHLLSQNSTPAQPSSNGSSDASQSVDGTRQELNQSQNATVQFSVMTEAQ